METGVVLCAGTTLPADRRVENILALDADKWTYISPVFSLKPDIFGSIYSFETIQEAGFREHRYVIERNCPFGPSLANWESIIVAASFLLRSGGSFITTGLVTFIIRDIEQERRLGRERSSDVEIQERERLEMRDPNVRRERIKRRDDVWHEYLNGGPVVDTFKEILGRLAEIGNFIYPPTFIDIPDKLGQEPTGYPGLIFIKK